MRRSVLLLTMVGAMLLAFSGVLLAQTTAPNDPATPGSAQQRAGDVRPDHYIVVLKDGVSGARAVANEHARDDGARVSHVYEYALKGYAAYIPPASLDRVKNDPRVAFVEQDYVQEAFAQMLPTGINRIEGEQSPTAKIDKQDGTTSDGQRVDVDIAVLDTGIQKDHPDLAVAGGYNCTSGKTDRYGDGHGHGTHVAGTSGALDDGEGVVGAAPGARLWAMKVLNDKGSGFASWIICGIDRVTKHNDPLDTQGLEDIEVANMSLGGSGSDSDCGGSDSYHNAICKSVTGVNGGKGVTYAVAAGNAGTNFGGTVPATYKEVLTVTAVADFNGEPGGGAAATCRADTDETAADFSNFTNTIHEDRHHAIAAPGVCIRSTWKDGGYNTISGTSMASPHVAGTAALCIASGKCTGGPTDIMGKLRSDADARSNDPAISPYYGFKDDPNSPIRIDDLKSRYYGYLEYAGGY